MVFNQVQTRISARLVMLLPAMVMACDASGGNSAARVRDSAGIRVVESARRQWGPGGEWRIGEPTVTIGAALGTAPGQQLDRVMGATRLSNGTIVVADGGARMLLRYDETGRYLGATGRAGEGPGEFRALTWVGALEDDSLIAWDPGLYRMSVFTGSGDYVRDFQPSAPQLPTAVAVAGLASDGRLFMTREDRIALGGSGGVRRLPVSAVLVTRTGQESRVLGPLPGGAAMLKPAARTPGATIRTPVPFGASTLFAARGDALVVIDTDALEIRWHSLDGALVRVARRPHARLRVMPEHVAEYIEERLANVPPVAEIREGMRQSLEQVPPAEMFPAVRSVHVDAEQHVWLETGRPPTDSSATWSIFDPEGVWLGDLTLPASLTLLEIGTDYLLARSLDELDVQRVLLMPLDR